MSLEIDEILAQADEVFSSPEQMEAFNRLVEVSKSGSPAHVMQAFNVLDSTRGINTHVPYNLALHGLRRNPDKMLSYFEEMQQRKIRPNAFTYATIIGALTKARNATATRYVDEFLTKQEPINTFFLNSAVKAYVEFGKRQKATELLSTVVAKHNVTPNWLTLSIIPRALTTPHQFKDLFEALKPQLIPALKSSTTNPPLDNGNHPQTFLNQFFYDFLKVSDGPAYALIQLLQKQGVQISARLWGTLLKHFSFVKNEKVCSDLMRQESVHRPHFSLNTYNIVMGICKQLKEYHRVHEYMEEMSQKNILPDLVTYSIGLEAYAAMKSKSDFEKLAYSAQRGALDTILYNKLLNGFIQFNLLTECGTAFETMKAKRVQFDKVTWGHYIEFLALKGDWPQVTSLVTQTLSERNLDVYGFIKVFTRAVNVEKWDIVQQLLQHAVNYGFKIQGLTLRKLQHASAKYPEAKHLANLVQQL